MITSIKNIKKFKDKKNPIKFYYVIYFDYGEIKDSFTYLTQKSLKYWATKSITKLKKGMTINVFKVKDTQYFKIISITGGMTNE